MKPTPLSDDERADLVAYLDGELSGETARAIEAKLSQDPQLRAEADSLKQAYDLLDFLPGPPPPSPSFTEKTLSRLEPFRHTGPTPHPVGSLIWSVVLWGGLWLVAVAGSAMGGYYGYQAWVPHGPGEEELVRDLRIIENKRHYDRIDDVEFLEKLADPDLFGE